MKELCKTAVRAALVAAPVLFALLATAPHSWRHFELRRVTETPSPSGGDSSYHQYRQPRSARCCAAAHPKITDTSVRRG